VLAPLKTRNQLYANIFIITGEKVGNIIGEKVNQPHRHKGGHWFSLLSATGETRAFFRILASQEQTPENLRERLWLKTTPFSHQTYCSGKHEKSRGHVDTISEVFGHPIQSAITTSFCTTVLPTSLQTAKSCFKRYNTHKNVLQ
jgi:hypothetical protein